MIISLIIGAVLVAVTVIIYNSIISRYNKVKRAWSDVIVQERQKEKIIPELERIVKQYDAYESELQQGITSLRTMMGEISEGEINTKKLQEVEASTSQILKGINVSMESYPELKASSLYNNLMTELTEQQENVGAAIRIFNNNVEVHNTGIESFPNNLVNSLLNKKDVLELFSDTASSDSFEFKPIL